MRRSSILFTAAIGCGVALNLASGCGGHQTPSGFDPVTTGGSSSGGATSSGSSNGGGGGSGGPSGSSSGPIGMFGDGSVAQPPPQQQVTGDGGIPCPPGLMCNVSCSGGGSTRITGKVYDPAGKNPLYNVAVYVPATDLQPLPKGVPTGADACSCQALFKAGALTATSTAVDGSFTLTNVPVGNITLVLQIGKWRRALKVTTTACQTSAQPDKSLKLPGTLVGAGPNDNMPDIAVSTGGADTLECLMTRVGVPKSEYVAGAGQNGHVHIFSGGEARMGGRGGGGGGGGGGVGRAEGAPMPGAPPSPTGLWANQSQLMPYDITLLSCEGAETYNANPAALEQYLNAGGRAFGSHFHYSFFSGPLDSTGANMYTAPADWGPNLSQWIADSKSFQIDGPIGGIIDTTLNGSTTAFAKGVALQQWLKLVNALGTDGVPATDLAIYQPRFNSIVTPPNKPSQPWITSDSAFNPGGGLGGGGGMTPTQTMYFSFDTPVSGPKYCGRAVFSDLHVAGNPTTNDLGNGPGGAGGGGGGGFGAVAPPDGCDAMVDLSPQEKALEFMLFDLSSCVISDTVPPTPMPPSPPQ